MKWQLSSTPRSVTCWVNFRRKNAKRSRSTYFDCVICAEDVRAAAAFRANAKAVFRDEPVPLAVRTERRNLWREFFTFRPAMVSLAANALLLVGLDRRDLGIPRLLHQQITGVTAARFLSAVWPGPELPRRPRKGTGAGRPFFAATIDLHPGQKFDSFTYQIQD